MTHSRGTQLQATNAELFTLTNYLCFFTTKLQNMEVLKLQINVDILF